MPWGWAVLLVALGGAVGATLRHLASLAPAGPVRGVLLVNVLGSAVMGALLARADTLPPALLLLLATGVCGAMTTWSALAFHTWQLGRRDLPRAAAYLGLNLALGVGAATLAWLLLRP